MRYFIPLLLATNVIAQIGPNYERPETVTPPSYKGAVNWREARPLDLQKAAREVAERVLEERGQAPQA